MDGRSSAAGERLDHSLEIRIPRSLFVALNQRVEHEARKDPEITRAALARRALRYYLGRTAPVKP